MIDAFVTGFGFTVGGACALVALYVVGAYLIDKFGP